MPMIPPVIICPLSRTGDEIAGVTADEVAINLAAGTKIALRCRSKRPLRKCPDLREVFRGHSLSEEAKAALRWVAELYADFQRAKYRVAASAQAEPELAQTGEDR